MQASGTDIDVPQELLDFLSKLGARETAHGSRNLFTHLVGTGTLLAQWGNPNPVWVAGMFHSNYGTSAFSKARIGHESRPYVASIIGSEAEQLTFLFSAINPRAFIATAFHIHKGTQSRSDIAINKLPVSWVQLCQLIEISVANVIEQAAELRARGKNPQDYLRGQLNCQRLLSDGGRTALLGFMQA